MVALLVVLLVTNAVTLGAVVMLVRRRGRHAETAAVDAQAAEALAAAAPAVTTASVAKVRRLITIEILNPIELAGGRGRMFGIAGSIVPHLTRRIVYDQTVRQLRDQLAAHNVVADVRIHSLPPPPADTAVRAEPIRLGEPTADPNAMEADPAYEPPV